MNLWVERVARSRYDGRTRNAFNEYECCHWYARALSSYGLLQGLTGTRYDALKKVQASLSRKHRRPDSVDPVEYHQASPESVESPKAFRPSQPSYQENLSSTSSSAKTIFFLINIILITFGIVIALLLKSLDSSSKPQASFENQQNIQAAQLRRGPMQQPQQQSLPPAQQTVRLQQVQSIAAKPQPVAPAPTRTITPSKTKFSLALNGTMMMGDRRVALINGDIYEVGEMIDGLTVVGITLKQVNLVDKKGKTLVLSVKNR